MFHSGRVQTILVSGDASTRYYDEPTTMEQDLIDRGVPADGLILIMSSLILRCRESLARARAMAFVDLTVFDTQPRTLAPVERASRHPHDSSRY